MRECGEDLLVELSEMLFNELAFFRLMQDLDGSKAKVKAQLRGWRQVCFCFFVLVSLGEAAQTILFLKYFQLYYFYF